MGPSATTKEKENEPEMAQRLGSRVGGRGRLTLALARARLLGSQLYGVKSYDPVIRSLTAVALAVCAILAAAKLARRASRSRDNC